MRLWNRDHLQVGTNASQGALEAHLERHLRGRTGRTRAEQPDMRDTTVERHQLEVAAVGVQCRTNALDDGLNGIQNSHAAR